MPITPHAIDPSLAGVITAMVGLIVGIGGLFLNRSSHREQARQQAAANVAAEDRTKLDRTEQALDAVQRRAELAEAGESRSRQRIEALEDELDEERSLRRALFSAQESRCREELGAVVEALVVLRGVVTDEITRAAADAVIREVRSHPHELPPPPERPDPPA